MQQAFDQGELQGLHGVLVQKHGGTLAEIYFSGPDERWGSPMGHRDFGPEQLHDLRSVSKSVVGLLYGIALDQGLVPPPEAPLLPQFPNYVGLADGQRDAITIGHTLSMQMGQEWNENLPYTDPRNSEIAMERAPDKIGYILSRPVIYTPGQDWTYSGGATALLAELIRRESGMSLLEFAKLHLFDPLNIKNVDWVRGFDGRHSAASGLRLSARDLARIGHMIADKGMYDGQRIVSTDWLEQSFVPRADTGNMRYGYHWWLAPGATPPVWVAGLGNGGQHLSIGQKTNRVVVIQAGNYNQPGAWRLPSKVMYGHLIPNLPK